MTWYIIITQGLAMLCTTSMITALIERSWGSPIAGLAEDFGILSAGLHYAMACLLASDFSSQISLINQIWDHWAVSFLTNCRSKNFLFPVGWRQKINIIATLPIIQQFHSWFTVSVSALGNNNSYFKISISKFFFGVKIYFSMKFPWFLWMCKETT